MPDQFTLDAFHRLELAKTDRKPVMAEIDLISSHAPWSRTPRMIPRSAVGDGSVFDGMPADPALGEGHLALADAGAGGVRQLDRVLAERAGLLRRSTYGTDKTVLVVLGDHQPATIVSGQDADHDVPISVIAHDPRGARAGSTAGAGNPACTRRPRPRCGGWTRFRDRFLDAFADDGQ